MQIIACLAFFLFNDHACNITPFRNRGEPSPDYTGRTIRQKICVAKSDAVLKTECNKRSRRPPKKRVRLCTFSTCTAMQVMPRSSSSILNPKPKMSLTLPTCWSFQLGAGISTPWWLPLLGSRFSMADWLVLAHLVALHAVGRACMSVGRLPLAHIWSLEHGTLACACTQYMSVGRLIDPAFCKR